MAAKISAPGSIFAAAVAPVIIESKQGEFGSMLADIKPLQLTNVLDIGPGVLRSLGLAQNFSQPWRLASFSAARSMPLFNMHAALFDGWTMAAIAENPHVSAIYEDRPLKILQLPYAPPQGTYSVRTPSGMMNFTDTQWVRRLIGADIANAKGFAGQGVNATVVDTGGDKTNPQLFHMAKVTVMPGNHMDVIGHGCTTGDSYIYTSYCGLATLEDAYNRMSAEFGATESEIGFTAVPNRDVYTVGYDTSGGETAKTRLTAIHKIPYRGKLIRVRTTNNSEFVTTPWHEFLLRSRRDKTYRYERADRLYKHIVTRNWYLAAPDGAACVNGTDIFSSEENYLIGLYIAEGSLLLNRRPQCVTPQLIFSLNVNEVAAFRAFVDRMGHGTSMRSNDAVEFFGVEFIRKLVSAGFQVGGHKARTVSIPEMLLKQGEENILALMAGIIDGDGCIDRNRPRIRIVTVSRTLAEQIVNLLSLFGYKSSLNKNGNSGRHEFPGRNGQRYVSECAETWSVSVLGKSSHDLMRRISGYMVLHGDRKPRELSSKSWKSHKCLTWVRASEEVDFDGYLYDLTTGTQNYASGQKGMVFIHNTWCASALGGTKVTDRTFTALEHTPVICEGMAPSCNLAQVKALDFVIGTAPTSMLVAGLERAVQMNSDVISCSWGGSLTAKQPQDSPFYNVMQSIVDKGILMVVAAGNSGPGSSTIDDPGGMPQVLTVGAYNAVGNTFNSMFGVAGEASGFSSRGPTPWNDIKPDTIMPGAIIDSASAGIYPTEMSVSYSHVLHAQNAIAGTSMATPICAGLLACMRQAHKALLNKVLTNVEVKAMLAAFGPPKDNTSGWGPITWPLYEEWLFSQYNTKV